MSSPAINSSPSDTIQRLRLRVKGLVQGVGFRPFVYALAKTLNVTGWVQNNPQGVLIDLEGTPEQLQSFQQRLQFEKPPHAWLQTIEAQLLDPLGYIDFEIRPSDTAAQSVLQDRAKSALILPDLATCPACLAELFDPSNRRYRYPFTNCTHCGPRFSIIRSLPYDRANTTMANFTLCPTCQAEYDNPRNRRFHAQPNACPICGPQLEFWAAQGDKLGQDAAALQQAVDCIRQGKILALQGLGGFQLAVDATNESAVRRLRQRKRRPHKPLAVMYPDLQSLQEQCQVCEAAVQILQSAAAPILLLPLLNSKRPAPIAASVSPGNPYLGAMLPYTPLHHLLLAELKQPVVATSGNRSGTPICIDPQEALQTLGEIADGFLSHNRPIIRPIDDSVVQLIRGQPMILRRARGYAPVLVGLNRVEASNSNSKTQNSKLKTQNSLDSSVVLAVGGHLKNTVALYLHGQILIGQHLGDLDNVQTIERFQETLESLSKLYAVDPRVAPAIIACDAHPDYYSSQFARMLIESGQLYSEPRSELHSKSLALPAELPAKPPLLLPVQHHYAHVLSCLVDNNWQPPAFGIAWDGTGYGLDGTIWGGEVLWIPARLDRATAVSGFERVAHLRSFPLPGGERAVKEPRRCALGVLYECFGDRAFEIVAELPFALFDPQELLVLKTMLQRGVNCPQTSSVGRLFDAIASLLGLCQRASFEGQAAMQVEFAIADHATSATYPYSIVRTQKPEIRSLPSPATDRLNSDRLDSDPPLQLDYAPMLTAMLEDVRDRTPISVISATFHNTLIVGLVEMVYALRDRYPETQHIVLTGGCFQNRYLLERAINALQTTRLSVGWHRQIPTNDGGISAGQIAAALRTLQHNLV